MFVDVALGMVCRLLHHFRAAAWLFDGMSPQDYAIEACEKQAKIKNIFVYEHPAGAKSWKRASVVRLRGMKEVYEVNLNMCEFGMQPEDRDGVGLVYKPTRLLAISFVIAELMSRKCNGKHRHVRLVNGRVEKAAVYLNKFCDVLLKALEVEIKSRLSVPLFNMEEMIDLENEVNQEKQMEEEMKLQKQLKSG